MRIHDELFFAPGIRFADLGDNEAFPNHVEKRIAEYFLQPTQVLIQAGYAFAAGLVLVCTIDALVRLKIRKMETTRKDFLNWLKQLPCCSEKAVRETIYFKIRCGLVHEGRIKDGVAFSLENENVVFMKKEGAIVNPRLLLGEVETACEQYINSLRQDVSERHELYNFISNDFKRELKQ